MSYRMRGAGAHVYMGKWPLRANLFQNRRDPLRHRSWLVPHLVLYDVLLFTQTRRDLVAEGMLTHTVFIAIIGLGS